MRLRTFVRSWCLLSLCLPLSACQALDELLLPPSESERLDREIEIARKKQELERLKQQAQPSSTPAPTPAPTATPLFAGNHAPQIQVLDALLATTVRNNDTVRLVVKASDADGDPLEYSWSSVYTGLSATKGEQVVWYPAGQNLAGKTNSVTVTVIDKKGGSSTASLNIFVQADGTLLVREDTAAKPVLTSLIATRSDDGRILMRAAASDPGGGALRYRWTATAGQLTTPDAASTIWQAAGPEAGPIRIDLTVSTAAGLQTNGSFSFSRTADGSLSGGFSGTDVSLPGTGGLLPAQPDQASVAVVGRLLVRQDDAVFVYDPHSRTRSGLIKLGSLAPAAQSRDFALLYQAPDTQAHLLVNQADPALFGGQKLTHYALDLAGGTPGEVESLAYGPQPLSVTLAEGPFALQPGIGSVTYYLSGGQLRGVYRLTAPGQTQLRTGSFMATDFGPVLPSNLRIEAISAQGRMLASRNGTDLVLLNADGSETALAQLGNEGIRQPGGYVWNHKGDRIAFVSQESAAGGQSGGGKIYTLDLDGRLALLVDNPLQQDRGSLAFSLDDLFLSYAEYPYVYLQSPSDRRTRTGSYRLAELAHPERVSDLKLEVYDAGGQSLEWMP